MQQSLPIEYGAFKNELRSLKSTQKIRVVVTGAVARARYLDNVDDASVLQLLNRVASFQGTPLDADEVAQAAQLVKQQLQPAFI